ncbi:MAG TPA: MaoC/PaaZ C-terminal domain-containing protein [Egibacteraceae bacterium]|nr:MaoC/PaaZ C-terminal domain-containing protein [Egibacteraceae bacterium]
MPKFDEVKVGDQIPGESKTIDQMQLIQYAGASGDFNPLHWQEEFAGKVSPTGGIIAHGMYNAGLMSMVVTRWAGGPENVKRIKTSFRAPCPLGATVSFGGEVTALDEAARTATLAIWAELEDGSKVIDRGSSEAVVQLD